MAVNRVCCNNMSKSTSKHGITCEASLQPRESPSEDLKKIGQNFASFTLGTNLRAICT